MFDLLDLILLRRGIPKDDRTLAFRRIDGDPRSSVLYFLPWGTPFALARRVGLMPLPFLAAYEMPPAIVSSEPELSVRSVVALVADAQELLQQRGLSPSSTLIVGLSVGTFPAMHLANRIGARVCFIAGADRGDLMLWQSPATRIVKRRAMQKGFDLSHFTRGSCKATIPWTISPGWRPAACS